MTALGAFSSGDVLTAADLNALNNVTVLTHAGGASVNSGVEYTIPFTTELIDVSGWHDNVTNNTRITPNVAGLYIIYGWFIWNTMTEADIYGLIRKNGTQIALSAFRGALAPTGNIVTVAEANGTTDYFTLGMYQASLTARTVNSAQFGAVLLRNP